MREGEKGGLSALFRIFETRQFLTDFAGLGSLAEKRIGAKLRDYVYPALRANSYFGPNIKRLRNWEPPTWRYRVGQWRFFHDVDDERRIIFMTAADHRKQADR